MSTCIRACYSWTWGLFPCPGAPLCDTGFNPSLLASSREQERSFSATPSKHVTVRVMYTSRRVAAEERRAEDDISVSDCRIGQTPSRVKTQRHLSRPRASVNRASMQTRRIVGFGLSPFQVRLVPERSRRPLRDSGTLRSTIRPTAQLRIHTLQGPVQDLRRVQLLLQPPRTTSPVCVALRFCRRWLCQRDSQTAVQKTKKFYWGGPKLRGFSIGQPALCVCRL